MLFFRYNQVINKFKKYKNKRKSIANKCKQLSFLKNINKLESYVLISLRNRKNTHSLHESSYGYYLILLNQSILELVKFFLNIFFWKY